MKLPCLTFLLISLVPSVGFAEFDIEGEGHYQTTIIDKQSIQEKKRQDPHKKNVSSQNTASKDSENTPEEPKTSSIERFVQPLTRWAEDQLHDTSLVRKPNKKSPKPKSQKLNLRDAIRIAKKEHPGMVLGAEAISENGRDRFEIRIISQSGVIKTVSISDFHDRNDEIGDNEESEINNRSDSKQKFQLNEGGS